MRRIAALGVVGIMFGAGQAFGAFSIEEIHQASKAATDAFQTANPDHVQHFTGYKVWKAADDAKVKIYVNHDGMAMEYNYTCHKHDTGIECHAQ